MSGVDVVAKGAAWPAAAAEVMKRAGPTSRFAAWGSPPPRAAPLWLELARARRGGR